MGSSGRQKYGAPPAKSTHVAVIGPDARPPIRRSPSTQNRTNEVAPEEQRERVEGEAHVEGRPRSAETDAVSRSVP